MESITTFITTTTISYILLEIILVKYMRYRREKVEFNEFLGINFLLFLSSTIIGLVGLIIAGISEAIKEGYGGMLTKIAVIGMIVIIIAIGVYKVKRMLWIYTQKAGKKRRKNRR